jgi:hypothetical protein
MCIHVDGLTLSIASSVRVHNLFGRAYMLPAAIAHPYIVRHMVKHLRHN